MSKGRVKISQAKSFPELFKLAVLEENSTDIIYLKKFAKSRILTADVTEDIWSVGGHKTYLEEGRTISVVSTSTSDTAAGTGARTLLVGGLDGDYNPVNEVVVLTGTTPVLLTYKYLSIERVIVLTAGSGSTNAGTITLTETTGSSIQARIEIGRSQNQSSHFACPAGYTGFISFSLISCYRSSGTGVKRGELDVVVRNPSGVDYRQYTFGMSNDGTSTLTYELTMPYILPEKHRLHLEFTAEASGTYASAAYDILLLKGNWDLNSRHVGV